MGVIVSDHVKKADCVKCRVGQANYGRFCSLCFFTEQTQEKLRLVLEEESKSKKEKVQNIFAWVFTAIIFAAVIYAWSFLHK